MAPPKKGTKVEGTKKKSKPTGGIKSGSAARVMKGALDKKYRLSIKAVDLAIRETEMCLAKIAKHCRTSLEIAKKKTLKHDMLLQVLEQMCARSEVQKAARTARVDGKLKGDRNIVANASVGRVVKKHLGGDFRISATVLDAFSLIAEAELARFATSGASIINVSGRTTIKERDIIAVIKVSDH